MSNKKRIPRLRFPEFRGKGEWAVKRFDELCKFQQGIQVDLELQFKYPKKDYVKFLRIENYTQNSKDFRYIPTDLSGNKYITENEIAIVRYGATAGYIGKGFEGVLANNLFKLLPNKELHSNYLFHFLQSENTYKYFQSEMAGGAMPALSFGIVGCLQLPICSLPEQQRIADCLTSLDELVTAEVDKLEAYKAHKKGLMQKLFPAEGKTVPEWRFPEFRGKGEWEEINLIDTADKKKKWSFIGGPFGSNLKSSDYTETGVRIIQLQNIGDAEFIDSYKIYTSEEKANELLSCNIYPGEIILSKMGDPVGRACLISNHHPRYVMCSDGIRLVVNEKLYNKYFIYSLINSNQFRSTIENSSTGSTRKRIGLDVLRNLAMLVPKKSEQQKIADCLSSLDELISAQAQKIGALKMHKKGLMQGLFPSLGEVGE